MLLLKEAKEKLGYSYAKLSELTGIDKGVLANILHSHIPFSKETAVKIGRVLGLEDAPVIRAWKDKRIKEITDRLQAEIREIEES